MKNEQDTQIKMILDQIVASCRDVAQEGEAASYIPELSCADVSKLGCCITNMQGEQITSGDCRDLFTMQSISKMLIFTCALLDSGLESVLQTVSMEPSGDAFNAIINLEIKNNHKPLNPMINAGAIACMTLVRGATALEKYERVLSLAKQVSGNANLSMNRAVYLSEKGTGARNRALTYYMQSTGVIQGDVEDVLDAYFRICSIEVDCVDLSRIALVFANGGIHPVDGVPLLPRSITQRVNAAVMLCGTYDESGSIASTIGIPTKSGVSGGLLALVPNRMGIGIFSPALNAKGNSVAGLALLEKLSTECHLSIF